MHDYLRSKGLDPIAFLDFVGKTEKVDESIITRVTENISALREALGGVLIGNDDVLGIEQINDLLIRSIPPEEEEEFSQTINLLTEEQIKHCSLAPRIMHMHQAGNSSDGSKIEVLSYLQNSDGSVIPPSAFIPRLRLLNRLGVFELEIIEHTLGKLFSGDSKSPNYYSAIHFNISDNSLSMPNFIYELLLILKKYKVDPSIIGLEILEHDNYEANEIAVNNINNLVNHGIKIVMDDFGEGKSTLVRLMTIKGISGIKVDRKLFRRVKDSSNSDLIFSSMFLIARLRGLEIVVEGIEDQTDLEYIHTLSRALDVPLIAQGFFDGKPMRIEEHRKRTPAA